MNALQLVTTPRGFFRGQVEALERVGVRCRTVAVHETADDAGRSVLDYLRFYPSALARAWRGYDVIHANHGLAAPFALAQPARPVVCSFWGSDLLGEQTALHRLVARTSRLTARLVDGVVVPTRAMGARLDVDHAVVPFAVDTDRFRPIDRRAARAHVGWDPDGRVVLFPAAPSRPEKDFPLAERVVAETDAALRVVSAAPYREMPYYLNASDAVLVTSRRESGPMVVKEAAACNVPVVATDVGFTAEVLEGVTNAAVGDDFDELVDGLRRVLDSDGRSDGRDAVAGLDLETMGRRLRRVYDRAIARR